MQHPIRAMTQSATKTIQALDFEVFGKVQGVFFRKYTKKTCDKYHVNGWIINTEHGTVQGTLEGSSQSIETVKRWLQTKGSPSSRIERAEFFNIRSEQNKNFSTFKIIRDHVEVQKRTFKRLKY